MEPSANNATDNIDLTSPLSIRSCAFCHSTKCLQRVVSGPAASEQRLLENGLAANGPRADSVSLLRRFCLGRLRQLALLRTLGFFDRCFGHRRAVAVQRLPLDYFVGEDRPKFLIGYLQAVENSPKFFP